MSWANQSVRHEPDMRNIKNHSYPYHREESSSKQRVFRSHAPDAPSRKMDQGEDMPCFFPNEPQRESAPSLDTSTWRNRDDRPWETDSSPSRTISRTFQAQDPTSTNWFDSRLTSRAAREPLLDETFEQTMQLMARWDGDDEGEQPPAPLSAYKPPVSESIFVPAAHPPAQQQHHYFGETYHEDQSRDVAESPKRRRSVDQEESDYSPTSITSFPPQATTFPPVTTFPSQTSTKTSASVQYGQLLYVVDALKEFQFTLPGLTKRMRERFAHQVYAPTEDELIMARRRLTSAICFFGGGRPQPTSQELEQMNPLAVRFRRKYEFLLSRRYRLYENHLSWDLEENPPVGRPLRMHPLRSMENKRDSQSIISSKLEDELKECISSSKIQKTADGGYSRHDKSNQSDKEDDALPSTQERKKAPYHCRLCGQPKQKHDCPFRRDLQRNIGTMIYPVINAYKTDEIGELAPRLSDMNNFVSGGYKPPIEPEPKKEEDSVKSDASGQNVPDPAKNSKFTTSNPLTKRPKVVVDCSSAITTIDILPQQFKNVTPVLKMSPVAYRYAAVPVVNCRRAKLSHDLFRISEQVPNLTKECALILDEAHEMNLWDQAIAELFAQVLAIIHCPVGDHKLDGLSAHMKSLGIAC